MGPTDRQLKERQDVRIDQFAISRRELKQRWPKQISS